jgi:hypothetical protein
MTDRKPTDRIFIWKWHSDERYTHAFRGGYSDDHSSVSGYAIVADPQKFIEIAKIAGFLEERSGNLYCDMRCNELCEFVEDVLEYSKDQIDIAQGQMEEAVESGGGDPSGIASMSPIEVAVIDLLAREALADAAKSCKNPWGYRVLISLDFENIVENIITEYWKRR